MKSCVVNGTIFRKSGQRRLARGHILLLSSGGCVLAIQHKSTKMRYKGVFATIDEAFPTYSEIAQR